MQYHHSTTEEFADDLLELDELILYRTHQNRFQIQGRTFLIDKLGWKRYLTMKLTLDREFDSYHINRWYSNEEIGFETFNESSVSIERGNKIINKIQKHLKSKNLVSEEIIGHIKFGQKAPATKYTKRK